MRYIIFAAVLLALFTPPSFGETARVYVSASGGVALGPDGTTRDVLSEVGVRIAPQLSVFGALGRFHNLEASEQQPAISATDATLATDGLNVIGSEQVPAWYSLGGLRLSAPIGNRLVPYVLGGIGVARVTPHASFVYANGGMFGGATPTTGQDITGDVLSMDVFTPPSPSNALMYSIGSGADLQLDRHITLGAGYRFSHVATDTPLHAHSVTIGVGYRF